MSQLFVNKQYLMSRGVIHDDVDMKLITPIISTVEDLNIRPLLGSNLYNQIKTQAEANALSTNNKNLLDNYILTTEVLFIHAELLMVLKFQYTNKGIMVSNGQDSSSIETSDLLKLKDFWANKAESYGNLMQRFIRANPTLYPEFFTNNSIDQRRPDADPFTCDIFLPDLNERFRSEWIDLEAERLLNRTRESNG